MSRPTKRTLAILALTGLVGWLVASKLTTGQEQTASSGEESDSQASLVTTYQVEPIRLVDAISTVGTLVAAESLEIRNEVPGKVTRLGFTEGERVDEGQLLLQMRSASTRARLEVKKRRRDLLEKEVARNRTVLEKGGISQQEFDITKNELEVLEAEIDEVRAELAKRTIRAPFAGVVGLREVSPGAILTTGTRVATLRQLDPIELEFTVPERFADKIEEGTAVKFRTHGTDRIHRAEVFAFEPKLDRENRTLLVRARTSNDDGKFRPGAYAQVRTVVDERKEALAVPATALVTSSRNNQVWLNVDGKAKKQEVEIGMRTEKLVEIVEGVSAGDAVVTTGRQQLSAGAKLKIDKSSDAMDVSEIAPDPSRGGMQNKWFSEEPLEEASDEKASEEAGQ